MLHEPKIGDQRPREQKRDANNRALLLAGIAAGAALFPLGVWIVTLFNGQGYSAFVYIVAAVVGGGVGSVLPPLISLERQDGADAEIVRTRRGRGRADAPVEGAQAADDLSPPNDAGRTG